MTEWCFACPDWKERLAQGRSLIPPLPLDRDLASRAVRIFNKLRLPDVSGKPELRDAGGDWQRDIVAALFGSLMPDGRRMVSKLLNLIPKKNNKTTGSAAIMLTALIMDGEPRQNFSLLGATQKISDRGFAQAKGMILADPVLRQRFHIRDHVKTIVDQVTESELKVQTFDEKVVTGDIPKGILVDELHILGKMRNAGRVWQQLTGGLVARPAGFLISITTQSDESPAGIFRDELKIARRIRDGAIEGDAALAVLPVLYEFPEEFQTDKGEPWRDPQFWPRVLPNLGRSVHLPALRLQYAEAVEKGAHALQIWASQHLNIEIGLGLHSDRWRGADHWLGATEEGLTLETLLERCEVAVCGIDGGGLDDLFGLAVIGRDRDSGDWLAWAHGWVMRDVLELRQEIAPRLLDFEREGTLTICDKATQDIEEAADLVGRINDAGLLPEQAAVGLDPLAVGALVDELTRKGLSAEQQRAIGQGFKLSPAVWTSERRLRDGTLRHDGSDLMAWCVGNAKAEQRGDAVYITKEAAGKAKIDPLIALFNAVRLMERNPVAASAKPPSAWEDPEFSMVTA